MVGASAVAAAAVRIAVAAVRIAVRDDFTVAVVAL
jgi:hypothetical protein